MSQAADSFSLLHPWCQRIDASSRRSISARSRHSIQHPTNPSRSAHCFSVCRLHVATTTTTASAPVILLHNTKSEILPRIVQQLRRPLQTRGCI